MAKIFEHAMLSYLNTAVESGKLYFRPVPQKATFPHGVILKVLAGKTYTHQGPAWYRTEMQVSVFGKSFVEARKMADEVIAKLEVWPEVQAVLLNQDGDAFDQEDQTHHVALVFQIHHDFNIL